MAATTATAPSPRVLHCRIRTLPRVDSDASFSAPSGRVGYRLVNDRWRSGESMKVLAGDEAHAVVHLRERGLGGVAGLVGTRAQQARELGGVAADLVEPGL